MKKLSKYALFLLLTLIAATSFAACGKVDFIEPIVLNAPSGLKITGNNLSWQLVENAEGYIIQIDGEAPFDNGAGTSFSLSALTAKKVYSLKVKAKGNGTEYLDSEYSAIIEYTGDDGHSVKSADGFTMTGNLGYCKVSNTTAVFSFIEKITVSPGAAWTVSTDIYGTNIIPTKTIVLAEGDNTVYILVKAQDSSDISLYTFTVRRKLIYTVSFNMGGGTKVDPRQVEEDSFTPRPTETVSRTGYTFVDWDFDFDAPITGNTEVAAIWAGNKYGATFNADGGNIGETQKEVICGSQYSFEIPVHEYYTFGGWYTEVGGGGLLYSNSGTWTTASDVSLYAYWLGTPGLNYGSNGDAYSVSKGTANTAGTVIIQEYYNGKLVTAIANNAFSGYSSLTSITIPDSVTSIGEYAFYKCSSLTSITIPSGVSSIESSAFRSCSSLASITIPDSVTSIGNYAFYNCSSLINITVNIGNTKYHSSGNCLIETAPKTLIAGCSGSVIPSDGSVTSIGSSAFSGCSSLTAITIPDSVTSIGYYAFDGCSSLTSITFADTTTWYRTKSSSYTDGTQTNVTNTSTNATYFKSTYSYYCWYKT